MGNVCQFMCVRVSGRCKESGRVLLVVLLCDGLALALFLDWKGRAVVAAVGTLMGTGEGLAGCNHLTCRCKENHGRNYERRK